MKRLYFVFIFCFYATLLFSEENILNEKSSDEKSIYLLISFDNNLKINGKTVIDDLSTDVPKFIKKYDSTSDMLKSGKFIYEKDEIDKYSGYKELFLDYTKSYLEGILNTSVITISTNEEISQLQKAFIIDIKLNEYVEGEYNLIKNRNSIVKLLVKLHEKSLKDNIFLIKIAVLSCKSDIEYPTENMRLKNISEKISKEILSFIKNYNINKKNK